MCIEAAIKQIAADKRIEVSPKCGGTTDALHYAIAWKQSNFHHKFDEQHSMWKLLQKKRHKHKK